ncbi:MAG: hypothetical protein SF029_23450 [bacterium]|nr:hypothetical protein [bacterium]
MKRFTIIMALLLAMFTFSGAARAQFAGVETVITAQTHLRQGPGREFNAIRVASAGTPLLLDGRNYNGQWVRGQVDTGEIGWLSAGVIRLPLERILGLPVIQPDDPFTASRPEPNTEAVPVETTPEAAAPTTAPAAPETPGVEILAPTELGSPPNPGAAVAPGFIVYPEDNYNPTPPSAYFSYGGHVATMTPTVINLMQQARMTWIKRQMQAGAPVGDVITSAHGNGFKILMSVVGGPSAVAVPGYFEQYAAYVAYVAASGADAIEIWNEPNLDREWQPPIDPARYTELLRLSYNAIKAANPNTIVISAALAPTGAEGAFPGRVMNDDRFLGAMAAFGAAQYMDCVGAHYNEGIVPPSQTSGDPRSEHYSRYFLAMVNLYYGTMQKPVCFTELGYLSPEGYGPLPWNFAWAQNTTVAQQAAWLDEVMVIGRNTGVVPLIIVWNIDFTGYGDDPMAGYAIIRPNGTCPACVVLGS